jgi:hypothetical protein
VWEENPELPGLREVYRGRAEVRAWTEEVLEVVESPRLELEEITGLGDVRVFRRDLSHGARQGSGAPVELRFWMVGSFAVVGRVAADVVDLQRHVRSAAAAGATVDREHPRPELRELGSPTSTR